MHSPGPRRRRTLRQWWREDIAPDLSEDELDQPNLKTPIRLVWYAVRGFFVERPGQIIGSSFLLLMLWGTHGQLELLGKLVPTWGGPGNSLQGRGPLIAGLPWDRELISFLAGFVLLVVVPVALIGFGFRERLTRYGLGLPPADRWWLAAVSLAVLGGISLVAFWFGAQDADMRALYPLYRPFSSPAPFVLYELSYLPFFVAIEFIFRGYLLFGLAGVRDREVAGGRGGVPGPAFFGRCALLIQMLSYTAWHLGKPLPELWGTLVWGLAAGAITLLHWLLNVFLDALIARPF